MNIPFTRTQSKLTPLGNIQRDFTVNSDLDRQIQKRYFRDGRFGMSKQFNTKRNFATFGQSELQVQCKRKLS